MHDFCIKTPPPTFPSPYSKLLVPPLFGCCKHPAGGVRAAANFFAMKNVTGAHNVYKIR